MLVSDNPPFHLNYHKRLFLYFHLILFPFFERGDMGWVAYRAIHQRRQRGAWGNKDWLVREQTKLGPGTNNTLASLHSSQVAVDQKNDRQRRSLTSHRNKACKNLSCEVFELSIQVFQYSYLSPQSLFSFLCFLPLILCPSCHAHRKYCWTVSTRTSTCHIIAPLSVIFFPHVAGLISTSSNYTPECVCNMRQKT